MARRARLAVKEDRNVRIAPPDLLDEGAQRNDRERDLFEITATPSAALLDGDLTLPPGGVVLEPPLPAPLTAVTVNGAPSTDFASDRVTIRTFPAQVRLEY